MHIVEFTPGTLRFLDERAGAGAARTASSGSTWTARACRQHLPALQAACQRLGGSALLDLHVKDLGNRAHPSHYDYTSVYDLVVFRRLATREEVDRELQEHAAGAPRRARRAGQLLPHPHPRRSASWCSTGCW